MEEGKFNNGRGDREQRGREGRKGEGVRKAESELHRAIYRLGQIYITWRVGEWKNERGRENGEWERPVMYENVK